MHESQREFNNSYFIKTTCEEPFGVIRATCGLFSMRMVELLNNLNFLWKKK